MLLLIKLMIFIYVKKLIMLMLLRFRTGPRATHVVLGGHLLASPGLVHQSWLLQLPLSNANGDLSLVAAVSL